MQITFKQFEQILALSEDQLTEEKLTEIFGWSPEEKKAKAQKALADLQAKKASAMKTLALKKQQERETVKRAGGLSGWTGQATKPEKPEGRHGERRASDFAFANRGMKEAKDSAITLDHIHKLIKPMHDELTRVDSQKEYDAFLNKHYEHSHVIDRYFDPSSAHKTASHLHYHQREPDIKDLLDHLHKGKEHPRETEFWERKVKESEDKISTALAYMKDLLSKGYLDSWKDALLDATKVNKLNTDEAKLLRKKYLEKK